MKYATVLKNGVPVPGATDGMFFGESVKDLYQIIEHLFGENISYFGAHPTRMFHIDFVGTVPEDMERYRENSENSGALSRAAG